MTSLLTGMMKKYFLICLIISGAVPLVGCSTTTATTQETGLPTTKIYGSIEEMLEDPLARFYFGEVTSIVENYNDWVDMIQFTLYVSPDESSTFTIRLSELKDDNHLVLGNRYFLHMTYNATYDYYSLSTIGCSTFPVDENDYVQIPEYLQSSLGSIQEPLSVFFDLVVDEAYINSLVGDS